MQTTGSPIQLILSPTDVLLLPLTRAWRAEGCNPGEVCRKNCALVPVVFSAGVMPDVRYSPKNKMGRVGVSESFGTSRINCRNNFSRQ